MQSNSCGHESSRVEPVRQKMAGPIGHRREKEMKRDKLQNIYTKFNLQSKPAEVDEVVQMGFPPPPPGTNWNLDWHEILHFWNERVAHFAALASVKSWSQSVCIHYWKFARYVACLPSHRWVKPVLAWTPPGSRNAGRPADTWEHKLVTYCRYKNFGNWMDPTICRHSFL